jgi:hypothetical protein
MDISQTLCNFSRNSSQKKIKVEQRVRILSKYYSDQCSHSVLRFLGRTFSKYKDLIFLVQNSKLSRGKDQMDIN